MLHVRVICVGKLGEKFWKEAVQEYEKRLSAYCRLEILELPECRLPASPSEGEREAALWKEAGAIREKMPPGAKIYALCIEGRQLTSVEFSRRLQGVMMGGASRICFIIGGSFGLHAALKAEASFQLSMSPMTFPHHLARVMLLEQLYRALNLANGGKYHK